MLNYWVAYTQYNDRKYACLFSNFKDSEKYLQAILEMDYHFDFKEKIRENFAIKCFEDKMSAQKFRDDFLEMGV